MPTTIRPGTRGSGQEAIERLREAKRSADRRRAGGATRIRRPATAPGPGQPVEPTSSDKPRRAAAPEITAEPKMAVAPETAFVLDADADAPAEVTPLPAVPAHAHEPASRFPVPWSRGRIMASASRSPRFRAALVAVQVAVLLAGIGVVARTSSRGALTASNGPGVTSLVNPGGVLNSPIAQKLVDGSAIKPIDSTPYEIPLGGEARDFRLHFSGDVPPKTARPLIIVLPGLYLSARDAERKYGLDQLSDTTGATIAYLDGVRDSWDAGTCCGYAAAEKLNDVGALHVIVDALANLVRVDRRHVVLAGFSNGAMLAYRTACSESNQLAGVIIASGSLQVSNCKPGPLTLVVSHGARDTILPTKGLAYSNFLKTPVTSMAASLAPFETADACKAKTTWRTGRYAITRLHGCASGVSVTTYVDGLGGHTWDGKVPVQGVVGGQSFAFAAWQLIGGRASVVPFTP